MSAHARAAQAAEFASQAAGGLQARISGGPGFAVTGPCDGKAAPT